MMLTYLGLGEMGRGRKRTFFEALNLLVGEWGAIALQFALETEPHLRILVARRSSAAHMIRSAVRHVSISAICIDVLRNISSLFPPHINQSFSLSRSLCMFTMLTFGTQRRDVRGGWWRREGVSDIVCSIELYRCTTTTTTFGNEIFQISRFPLVLYIALTKLTKKREREWML